MLKISFCAKCHSHLWKFGGVAVESYEQICYEYINERQPLEVDESCSRTHQLVKFLELKNYILTTEIGNVVMVKPLGYQSDAGLHFFCAKGCNE